MAYDPPPAPDANFASLLRDCSPRLDALYAESAASRWGVSQPQFALVLEQSVRKRFASGGLSRECLQDYLGTLYVEDLALACGCMLGSETAWECFVRDYRGYLRACASAITKGGRGAIHAHELADSLFAELYGLADGKRGERSLFRYFHGRSSLKTWLRAILAQRHIDKIRETRRWQSLDESDESSTSITSSSQSVQTPELDPHREHYLACFATALNAALRNLDPIDHQRLDLYYSQRKTLAEIGRLLGEHESSVSRHLERIRRELRDLVEAQLRAGASYPDGHDANTQTGMSEAQIALCFQYAAEDPPIDFRNLFPVKFPRKPDGERGELS